MADNNNKAKIQGYGEAILDLCDYVMNSTTIDGQAAIGHLLEKWRKQKEQDGTTNNNTPRG